MKPWAFVDHGDCRAVLAGGDADSVDAIVTDPPYGLAFMGKGWDSEVPGPEFWAACLRTAKPGAHLLAFGGTRKHHRLGCAIEDAGWEIRDTIVWLYAQGMPKSHALLKPAVEPIYLARKAGAAGALNIDACRIPATTKGKHTRATDRGNHTRATDRAAQFAQRAGDPCDGKGRWPANVALDEEAAAALDEQSGILTSGFSAGFVGEVHTSVAMGAKRREIRPESVYADSGGASRFFYCAKASKAERTHGGTIDNRHPTVKPVALMRWLIRLITPRGGLVLDPFCGSGTTLVAALLEGFDAYGIDSDLESVDIARQRVERWRDAA